MCHQYLWHLHLYLFAWCHTTAGALQAHLSWSPSCLSLLPSSRSGYGSLPTFRSEHTQSRLTATQLLCLLPALLVYSLSHSGYSWLCLGVHDRQFHLPSHLSTSPSIDWDFMSMLTYSTLQLVILLLCALQLDCKKPSNVHATSLKSSNAS